MVVPVIMVVLVRPVSAADRGSEEPRATANVAPWLVTCAISTISPSTSPALGHTMSSAYVTLYGSTAKPAYTDCAAVEMQQQVPQTSKMAANSAARAVCGHSADTQARHSAGCGTQRTPLMRIERVAPFAASARRRHVSIGASATPPLRPAQPTRLSNVAQPFVPQYSVPYCTSFGLPSW